MVIRDFVLRYFRGNLGLCRMVLEGGYNARSYRTGEETEQRIRKAYYGSI